MTAEQMYSIELTEWAKTVDFYLAQLDIYQERLAEVAAKNNRLNVTPSIELYQNQFVVQKDALQTIQHDIHQQQTKIAEEVKEISKLKNLDIVDEEFLLRDRVQVAEKILLELKHSFYRFLSKVL